MKKVFILFVFLIFFGFIMKNTSGTSHASKLVDQVLGKTASVVRKKYNLIPVGSGASMPGGPIRELALCFNTKSSLKKEDLRKLLILIAEELVFQVNSTNEIQSYIANPPFTKKDVQIIIYNFDEHKRDLYDPEIAVAEFSEGKLNYLTKDKLKKYGYKNEYYETYEEAVKLLSDTE